ncbi:MAG: NADH-quinone oxidoreductase subunit N [Planctomycetes bacterium]|nr:NADH-quinone oxidoreductase subunit N [Planctomycetota bacterium]
MNVGAHDLRAFAPGLALSAAAVAVLLVDAFGRRKGATEASAVAGLVVSLVLALRGFLDPAGEAFGGLLVEDRWTAAVAVLSIGCAIVAAATARETFAPAAEKPGEFHSLLLLAPVGMILLAGARHLLLLVLGIEVLSIAFYVLAAFDRTRAASVEAGLKYFLLGSFALALLLYGGAVLFGASGSFSLGATGFGAEPARTAGACLLLAGLLFKASAAPFHFWTPDVYEGAPTPVVGLFAAATKAAAVAAIFRWSGIVPEATRILSVAAVLTLLVGGAGALVQTSLKRLLAYSAIGHAGILLIAAAAHSAGGDEVSRGASEAAVFYLLAYAPMTLGAFALLAAHERDGGGFDIEGLRGVGRARPLWTAALVLFLASLGGLPPTGGFFAKLFVFESAVRAGLVPLAVAGVLLSVVSLAAYLRVVAAAVIAADPRPGEARAGPGAVAWVCAAAVVALGLFPGAALERLTGLL